MVEGRRVRAGGNRGRGGGAGWKEGQSVAGLGSPSLSPLPPSRSSACRSSPEHEAAHLGIAERIAALTGRKGPYQQFGPTYASRLSSTHVKYLPHAIISLGRISDGHLGAASCLLLSGCPGRGPSVIHGRGPQVIGLPPPSPQAIAPEFFAFCCCFLGPGAWLDEQNRSQVYISATQQTSPALSCCRAAGLSTLSPSPPVARALPVRPPPPLGSVGHFP